MPAPATLGKDLSAYINSLLLLVYSSGTHILQRHN